ncbi:monooxygenase [Kitasatospora sp. MMS16-BH015]|uniref:LLM class F420-dependent oxidoreductase n=1 Tax=Kitasatospora sp. MMS16-BH015 TaxID=2018025 RepID=UPI000CA35D29|nr:LLM class F420-dependent oxidoreductase [Kitasatospora sp. MMS16-BH015]AUG77886.1 monooxygenase [Kitasatospora sp. MMS16-BH015]
MRLGVQIRDFTWSGGPARLGPRLGRVAAEADAAGFAYISVADHLFQVSSVGPPEGEMLEAYTTLGFLAAHTSRAKLMTLVTAVTHRHPGLLAKIVSTLDVLSGGRAVLGIGAGWNAEENHGLGLPFPPVAERFERLEDTLRLCLRMWGEGEEPFEGTHVHAARTLNSPQPLSRPHPPIMVGGMGERKTLRLVAKYAQACNLFPGPDLPRKLAVLREHCEREGRDYDTIEKSAYYVLDPGPDGRNVPRILDELGALAELGIETAIGGVPGIENLEPLALLGEQVVPAVKGI